jgi:elongator complex protein 1
LLKLTPLRHANIPPPMALHELTLRGEAIDVSINAAASLIAVLNERAVDVYNYNTKKRKISDPKLSRTFSLPDAWGTPYQVTLSGDMQIAVLTQSSESGVQLYRVDLNGSESSEALIEISPKSADAASLLLANDTDRIFFASPAGQIEHLDSEISHAGPLRLPVFCPWTEVLENEGSVSLLHCNQ